MQKARHPRPHRSFGQQLKMIKQKTKKDGRRKSLQTLSHKCQVNHGIVNNCTFLGAEGPALVITGDKVRLFLDALASLDFKLSLSE